MCPKTYTFYIFHCLKFTHGIMTKQKGLCMQLIYKGWVVKKCDSLYFQESIEIFKPHAGISPYKSPPVMSKTPFQKFSGLRFATAQYFSN